MIAWIARDSNGDLFLYDKKPVKGCGADKTSGGWNPHYEFNYWSTDGGRIGKIKLHQNTHKDVKPGECKQVTVKIK